MAENKGLGDWTATMATIQQTTSSSFDIGFSTTFDEMLVSLHDAQKRYTLSDKTDGLLRTRVVESVAELIGNDLSRSERDQLAEILMGLVRQAELDLRESLSERLCMMKEVPEELVLEFAHDTISVARPVLENSPILTPDDLLYIIQSKGAEYWRAIARRKLLESGVIDALVERNDETTAINLLLNDAIDLRSKVLDIFAELSKYSDKLAEPLLNRKELPERIAMDLFWHVATHLRARIVQTYNIPKERLDAALQDALEDFADTANGLQDPKPSSLMVGLAREYGRLERINDAMLLKTLRRGQVRFFIALLAERTGLDHNTVHQIMRQVGGQGMAVASKACKISKENFVSLFLLARSLTRGDIAIDAMELRKAIRYYDALTEDIAATIMADTILDKSA